MRNARTRHARVPIPRRSRKSAAPNNPTNATNMIAYAVPMGISAEPNIPYRKAFTIYRIGFANATVCQNGDNSEIEKNTPPR